MRTFAPAEFAPAALPVSLGSPSSATPGGSDPSSSAHPPAAKTPGTFALRHLSTRIPPLRPGSAANGTVTGILRGMKANASHGTTSPPATAASARARPTILCTFPLPRLIPLARAASEMTSNTGELGFAGCQHDTIRETFAPRTERRSATWSPLVPSPQTSIRPAEAMAEPNSLYRVGESRTKEPGLRSPWATGGSKREPAAKTRESARKRDPSEATASPLRIAIISIPRKEAQASTLAAWLEIARLWPSGLDRRSGHDDQGGSGSSRRSTTVVSTPCMTHSSAAAVPAVPPPTTKTLDTETDRSLRRYNRQTGRSEHASGSRRQT